MSASGRASRPPVIFLWLAGRDLSGHWHTNATWLHDATKVLHVTGNATRWQRMRHWKRSAIRNGIPALAAVSAWDYWHHPAVTLLALSLLAAIPVSHWTWRAVRTFLPIRHYWQWVRPFRHTLQAELGVVPERLAIEPDRSRAVIVLPEEFLGTEPARAAIAKAVTEKLGMIEPDPAWKLRGRSHEVEFTQSRPPPLKVTFADIRGAVEAAEDHEVILGLDRDGEPYKRSLATETPHVAICMPTGDGKSVTVMNIAAQCLFHGWLLIVLDYKMLSHAWADGPELRDRVCYAWTPAMIHEVLMWLACDDYQESELTYRKKLAKANHDIEGNVLGDLGPRIAVVVEERKATTRQLKRYWRSLPGARGPSPALDAIDELGETGRQFGISVWHVGQSLSAGAMSGSGSRDSHENVGLWVFGGGTTKRTWDLLTDGHPFPPPTTHKGRYNVVYRQSVDTIQSPFEPGGKAQRDALAFALSGTRAVPHRDMPFTRHVAAVAGHAIGPGGPEQAVVERQAPVLTRPPGTATIIEAHGAGVLGRCTVPAARKRVQRAGLAPAGTEGKENLYPIDRLKELVR